MNSQFQVPPLTPKEARIVEVMLAADKAEMEAREIIDRAEDLCASTVFSTLCRMARRGYLVRVKDKPRHVYRLGLYIVMVQLYGQESKEISKESPAEAIETIDWWLAED